MGKAELFMKNTTNSGKRNTDSAAKIRRACAILLPLYFFSILLSAALISVTNDLYAFVKPDKNIIVTLDGGNIFDTARHLEKSGVINNPTCFALYVRSKSAEERVLSFSGELSLNSSMSYREILTSFPKI